MSHDPTEPASSLSPLARTAIVLWFGLVVGLLVATAELPGPPLGGSLQRLMQVLERLR